MFNNFSRVATLKCAISELRWSWKVFCDSKHRIQTQLLDLIKAPRQRSPGSFCRVVSMNWHSRYFSERSGIVLVCLRVSEGFCFIRSVVCRLETLRGPCAHIWTFQWSPDRIPDFGNQLTSWYPPLYRSLSGGFKPSCGSSQRS